MSEPVPVTPDSPAALINRELSWLSFARRVLALAEDPEQPLLERVKFAGIMGMLYDEFAMKRIGGLFQQVRKGAGRRGPDGLTPAEVLGACRAELRSQQELVARLVDEQLRPALRDLGAPILDAGDPSQREFLARYFADLVEPILIPLAVDAAHPFPFISNLGLNLAVLVTEPSRPSSRPSCTPTNRTTARPGTCNLTVSTSAGTLPWARPGGVPSRYSSSARPVTRREATSITVRTGSRVPPRPSCAAGP